MPSRDYSQPDGHTTVTEKYTKISGKGQPPADRTRDEVNIIRRGQYRGSSTPRYHRRMKAGELIPHQSYTRFDSQADYPHGRYWGTYVNTSTPLSYSYEVNSVRDVPGAATTESAAWVKLQSLLKMSGINEDALLVEALANCKPELDAGTMLAEMSKTVQMVVGVRKRAAKYISDALRGGFRSARAASQAWLEWRYGWRVLGYDINSVVEYLNYPIRDAIVEGRAGQSYTRYDEVVRAFTGYYVRHNTVGQLQQDLSVRANVNVKFRGKSSNAFVSPATTGWELIPFSFVADWFVGVGDAIAAWEVLLSAEATTSSIGYKFTETGDIRLDNIQIGTGANARAPYGVSGNSHSYCELRSRAPRGIPLVYPRTRVKLDRAKIADLIAILATRIPTK